MANSTSIAGMMKLDGEQVVLDDGRFELLLVPNPKNAAELQNLIWALLNQQYDAGVGSFSAMSPPSMWKRTRTCHGRWMENTPTAAPLWTSPTVSAP